MLYAPQLKYWAADLAAQGLLSFTHRLIRATKRTQAHISSQTHLTVIVDVNNVTLRFPIPLAPLPPMFLCSAMTQV